MHGAELAVKTLLESVASMPSLAPPMALVELTSMVGVDSDVLVQLVHAAHLLTGVEVPQLIAELAVKPTMECVMLLNQYQQMQSYHLVQPLYSIGNQA